MANNITITDRKSVNTLFNSILDRLDALESKQNKKKSTGNEMFDSFWAIYPNPRDKGHAIKEFEKQIKNTAPEVIIEGAKKYATECIGKDREKIKYPQGWLSGQRWLDYEERPYIPKNVIVNNDWNKTRELLRQPEEEYTTPEEFHELTEKVLNKFK